MNQIKPVKSSASQPDVSNDDNDDDVLMTTKWIVFLSSIYYQFSRIIDENTNNGMTVWDAQFSALFYGRSLA